MLLPAIPTPLCKPTPSQKRRKRKKKRMGYPSKHVATTIVHQGEQGGDYWKNSLFKRGFPNLASVSSTVIPRFWTMLDKVFTNSTLASLYASSCRYCSV